MRSGRLAGERVQWGEEALTNLKAAKNFAAAEKAWTDFLIAAGAFYSKLEQGGKVSGGASSAWFGTEEEAAEG